MLKKFKTYILYIIILIFVCSVKNIHADSENTKKAGSKNTKAEKYIEIINQINEKIPPSFTTYISLNAYVNKVKYNVQGRAYFNNNPRKIKTKLNDLIFKSPMLDMLINNNIVKIFVPADGILYVRNINKARFKRNLLENNYKLITAAVLGRIPLIENYKINKIITKGKNKFLLIENENYFETISFSNNLPNKILIMRKDKKDKVEIYYYKPFKIKGYTFFKKIRALSRTTGHRCTVYYGKITPGENLKYKNRFYLKVPKGTKRK